VDLAKGSVQLEQKEKFYRHQVCTFLTLNEKNQLKINFIVLPSYADEENVLYRYNQLPYAYEWAKYKNQAILKAFFVQLPSQKQGDTTMYLLVQLRSRIVTVNVTTGQFKTFEADSSVPLLQFHPETCKPRNDAEAEKTVSFYKHVNEGESSPQQAIE
jgi:hypothetical protein